MDATWRFTLGTGALVAIALAALTIGGVGQRRAIVMAAARAAAQLAVVALALRGVFAAPFAVVALLAVMFAVATATTTRRLNGTRETLVAVLSGCLVSAGVSIGLIVGLPILSRDLRTLVAVSGIVIGGCMTATTLTGRRLVDGLNRRRDEIEAWLALGATMRVAVRPLVRHCIGEALVPGIDQTRTVGLVTLPGAFVGAILGGANPAQAARFQFVVLVGLMCAQSIAAVWLGWCLGAPQCLPESEATT